MKVLRCGTKAKFDGIYGTVASLEIAYSSVTYKFAYFDNDKNYKYVWVDILELDIENPQYDTIGFIKTKK